MRPLHCYQKLFRFGVVLMIVISQIFMYFLKSFLQGNVKKLISFLQLWFIDRNFIIVILRPVRLWSLATFWALCCRCFMAGFLVIRLGCGWLNYIFYFWPEFSFSNCQNFPFCGAFFNMKGTPDYCQYGL
jgi:hypothetical protein